MFTTFSNVILLQRANPSQISSFNIFDRESDGFKVLIMGDFNLDPDIYMDYLTNGRSPPAYFALHEFLMEQNFVDQHPLDSAGRPYATYYETRSTSSSPTSRIDQIWFPDEFILNKFCFDRVWQPPCSQLSLDAPFNLDHRAVIVYFTKALFVGDLPIHRRKQKGEKRKVYNVKSATSDHWA